MRLKLVLPALPASDGTLSDFTYLLKLLTPATSWGRKNRMAFMPLALPTLAALTPPDVDVAIVDENVEPIDFNQPTDLVGITAPSALAPRAYEIARGFRTRGVPVVLGGVHASLFPEEAAEHADTVIVGEAEGTWERYLEDFRAGKAQRIYRAERQPDLQRRAIPRWDLVSGRHYLTHLVQTTRGCAYHCDFCAIHTLFGRPRHKPVEHVIEELQAAARLKRFPGPFKVMFADDNIVANVGYAKRLFRAMAPLGIRWSSQLSVNLAADEELLDLAAASGCDTVLIGFESISQEALDAVHKAPVNKTLGYPAAIEAIHARGIGIYGYFIFGFDHDDVTVFERTVDFVQQTGIEWPLFNILSPTPGTALHARLQAEGRILRDSMAGLDGYSVCYRPARMTAEQLLQGFHWAIGRAYSREAILERIHKGLASGSMRAKARDLVSRAGASALLARDYLGASPGVQKLEKDILQLLWSKPAPKVNSLLMFLDRLAFAEQFSARHPVAAPPGTEDSR